MNSSGFTLVELLVVTSIIAILSSVAVVYFGTFLKNSRDGKRQADLGRIQSALEEYHSDQFYYPCGSGEDALTFGSSLTSSTGNCSAAELSVVKTYINILPTEALPSRSPYFYRALPSSCDNTTSKCTSYCVFASMESISNNIPSECAPLPVANPAYNFTVTKP